MPCLLCTPHAERLLVRQPAWRVIGVDHEPYAGYCRVVWNDHVAEMSDLAVADRSALMDVVFTVEAVLREQLQPAKINLASLGNQMPHLHWHVIPRWHDDPTFPAAVWAPPQRPAAARAADWSAIERALARRLGA